MASQTRLNVLQPWFSHGSGARSAVVGWCVDGRFGRGYLVFGSRSAVVQQNQVPKADAIIVNGNFVANQCNKKLVGDREAPAGISTPQSLAAQVCNDPLSAEFVDIDF
ncbi:hypothetical protein Bbelb_137360 [Branchiostoma belcheri]|nr:hypothetical protein Bbelb_137360 [Branchiostoma belcheri]